MRSRTTAFNSRMQSSELTFHHPLFLQIILNDPHFGGRGSFWKGWWELGRISLKYSNNSLLDPLLLIRSAAVEHRQRNLKQNS